VAPATLLFAAMIMPFISFDMTKTEGLKKGMNEHIKSARLFVLLIWQIVMATNQYRGVGRLQRSLL